MQQACLQGTTHESQLCMVQHLARHEHEHMANNNCWTSVRERTSLEAQLRQGALAGEKLADEGCRKAELRHAAHKLRAVEHHSVSSQDRLSRPCMRDGNLPVGFSCYNNEKRPAMTTKTHQLVLLCETEPVDAEKLLGVDQADAGVLRGVKQTRCQHNSLSVTVSQCNCGRQAPH